MRVWLWRSVSPRKDYILFSTCSPPAIQRVPWPNALGEGAEGASGGGYDTWEVNEEELPWLVDPDGTALHIVAICTVQLTVCAPVTVCQTSYHRQTGFETWITSDGRAYLVQLYQEQHIGPSASEVSTGDDERAQVNAFRPLLPLFPPFLIIPSLPSNSSDTSPRPADHRRTARARCDRSRGTGRACTASTRRAGCRSGSMSTRGTLRSIRMRSRAARWSSRSTPNSRCSPLALTGKVIRLDASRAHSGLRVKGG